jgi:ribosomal protein S18 acetylase RimI-like enzyme
MIKPITFRNEVSSADIENVRDILTSTGFFYDFEIDVAIELVQEYLEKGPESGYHFIFAEIEGKTLGYACFGPIPCTKHSYDLYWIGVHQDSRGNGIGRKVLQAAEKSISEMGGKKIFIETSSTEKYHPTRKFYLDNHYKEAALLKDFYAPGDSKHIYEKSL